MILGQAVLAPVRSGNGARSAGRTVKAGSTVLFREATDYVG